MPLLSSFPPGGKIFIDANIFLEHMLQGEPSCTAFFQRLSRKEIRAVTSVGVIAEVRHRLLLTEAVRRGYVTRPQRALETLRTKPSILRHLETCDAVLNALLEATVHRMVSVTPSQFKKAQKISIRFQLSTNDALHVASLRAHRLRHIASADYDFQRVRNLTVWSPKL